MRELFKLNMDRRMRKNCYQWWERQTCKLINVMINVMIKNLYLGQLSTLWHHRLTMWKNLYPCEDNRLMGVAIVL
ncbi:hypothetical protein TKK_0005618 [Trichogramma kaykai]